MLATKRNYESPSLVISGSAVDATRIAFSGSTEPAGPRLQEVEGDIGFGL